MSHFFPLEKRDIENCSASSKSYNARLTLKKYDIALFLKAILGVYQLIF